MKAFKLVDQHPGKHQDGLKVVPFRIIQKTSYYDIYHDVTTQLTCFRPLDSTVNKGMFGDCIEPVQVCEYKNGKLYFTMYNITQMRRDDLKELFEKGSLTINKNNHHVLLIEAITEKELEDFEPSYEAV